MEECVTFEPLLHQREHWQRAGITPGWVPDRESVELKWGVLLLCLLIVPLVGTWLRLSIRASSWTAFAIAFLPFVFNQWKLSFAPYSWPGWPGWPKGIEFTLLDFLAIAVLLSGRQKCGFKPLIPWLLYLAAVVGTLPLAGQKVAGIFFVWQLGRMIVTFMAVVKLAKSLRTSERLLHGIVAGVVYNLFFAGLQYVQGVPQPGGAIGHQNMLGLMSNFALIPCLMLLLVDRQKLWAIVGVSSALLLDVLTASRATLGLAGAGIAVALLFSCAKGMTSRKAALVSAFLFLASVSGPLAWKSLEHRRESSRNSTESSDFQREAMKSAAWMIIEDHPFGTGADQYVVVANMGGYSARAGVAWNPGSRGSGVHDSYLLVLAETGLIGLITMIFLILAPAIGGIRVAFRFRNDSRSELLLGFCVAIFVFAGHLWYEWAWVLAETEYTFATFAGVAVGLAVQIRSEDSKRRNIPPIAAEELSSKAGMILT